MNSQKLPVSVVAVNWERGKNLADSRAVVEKFYKDKGLSVPNVFDVDGKTLEAYGVNSFPTTLVIDPQGRIRYRNIGFHPMTEEILEAQLRSVLPGAAS